MAPLFCRELFQPRGGFISLSVPGLALWGSGVGVLPAAGGLRSFLWLAFSVLKEVCATSCLFCAAGEGRCVENPALSCFSPVASWVGSCVCVCVCTH